MKEILDAAALERALKRLSHEIEEKNDGLENVALIGIRTRGVIVAERIRRYIAESEGITLPVGILDITLYRDDILSCDAVVKGTRIDFETKGKTLVLCDDVLFTGRTVRAAISAVMALCSTMGRAKKNTASRSRGQRAQGTAVSGRLYRQKYSDVQKRKSVCPLYGNGRRRRHISFGLIRKKDIGNYFLVNREIFME